MRDLRLGVVGASGYTGGELCRLLLGHRNVATIVPGARTDEPFEEVHQNLRGSDLRFVPIDAVVECADRLDGVFLCGPTGEASRWAPAFLAADCPVVDLSADFRFEDSATFTAVHGVDHHAPELLSQAVYGFTERARHELPGARLVANPGCYVIAALLGLGPLVQSNYIDLGQSIRIDAVNGSTGAGSTPSRATMHANAATNMLSYDLDGHRHAPEIELQLSRQAGEQVAIDLSTAHGPFARGIHLHASVALHDDAVAAGRDGLLNLYLERYGRGHLGEHFVIVTDAPASAGRNNKDYSRFPKMSSVVGTNYCHIGVDVDRRTSRANVVVVIDNLGKGASGSAIQNLNVLLGLDERTGLDRYAT